jgi:catechol 2,3-dioxygenase-like lactoylglutathione lyase family enzyme
VPNVTQEQYFHVGIIVPDLLAARAHLTDLLGTEWGPVMDNEIAVRDADGGELTLPNRICYSTSPPHIELILETPGTPWVCNEHSNLHHIGFFSGTLDAASSHLEAGGCPLEIIGGHGSGPPSGWAYHRDPLGVRIELVDEALRAPMEGFMFRPPAH